MTMKKAISFPLPPIDRFPTVIVRASSSTRPMIRFVLTLALAALPLAGQAAEVCDFEHNCYNDAPPHQTYHMDPSNPDRETPPPAPQYPSTAAPGGHDITVHAAGEGCHLFRMRSVPNIEPQIVEICPVSPDEDRAIRERAEAQQ
jgi:hypothetical protein